MRREMRQKGTAPRGIFRNIRLNAVLDAGAKFVAHAFPLIMQR